MSQHTANGFQIERIGSITAIDPGEWDGIAGGDVAVSHGWLKTVEECLVAAPTTEYLLLRIDGRLVGATVYRVESGSGDVRDIDAYLFGRFKRSASALGLTIAPSVIGGIRHGRGNRLLVAPSITGNQRRGIMLRLLDAIEAHAFERKMGVCFDRVTEEQTLLMQMLDERGYGRTIDMPVAVMDIEWDSQQGYFRHLGSVRKNAGHRRREIRRNNEAGVSIRLQEAFSAPEEARLYRLLVDNREKYGDKLEFRSNYLSRAKANLGANAAIYVAEKRGDLVGICVLLIGEGAGYVLNIGVDHETAGNDFTYFNMSYYRPASDACSLGLKRIYHGTCHYEHKVSRGCRVMQAFVYYKSPRWVGNIAAKPFLKVHSAWYRSKLPVIARGG